MSESTFQSDIFASGDANSRANGGEEKLRLWKEKAKAARKPGLQQGYIVQSSGIPSLKHASYQDFTFPFCAFLEFR